MIQFPRALTGWLNSPLAQALVAAEARLLSEAFDDAYGLELLQVGAWGSGRALLAGSRTRRQSIVAEEPGAGELLARPTQLPVSSGAIDVVLLPHTLEIAADPAAVLREVDRVLVAEGQLFVLGFAPWGTWGLRSLCTRGGFPPGLRRLLAVNRLREWLTLLGFEVAPPRRYLYHWPVPPPQATEAVVASMLRRGLHNPWPAGAWLLRARKRVYGMTPLRPRWREQRRSVLGGLVEPSA